MKQFFTSQGAPVSRETKVGPFIGPDGDGSGAINEWRLKREAGGNDRGASGGVGRRAAGGEGRRTAALIVADQEAFLGADVFFPRTKRSKATRAAGVMP